MEKNTLLAVILAALVLFAYQFYVATNYPHGRGNLEIGAGEQKGEEPTFLRGDTQVASKGLSETAQYEVSTHPPEEISVETDKYVITLSNEGGCIKGIALKEYPDPLTNEMLDLVKTEVPEQGIFNIININGYDSSKTRFDTAEKDRGVVFSKRLENGLEIVKKYTFPQSSYHVDLEIFFNNTTDKTVQYAYSIVASSNIDIATKLDRRYAQAVSEISGKAGRDNGKKGDGLFKAGIVKYAGLQNKYFSVVTRPSVPSRGATSVQTSNDNLLSTIEIEQFTINYKAGATHKFLLYAGPTRKDIMVSYDLGSAVSYGFFGGISEMLVAGLKLFNRVFKNWGVAIILLSMCVNLMLFPLSRKSYESMKKMQELQPHMERLRNEHKDNPHKLNKEMMELYKKYNVNPMGGCLPLLLQIPIFVALYQALMRSLYLRGAKFLWIRDLSMPDAVPLPVNIAFVGNTINILPILMAVAMIFQQKIATKKGATDSAQAKQQQQMMIIMPVLFLFIMYNFPSGLVLYWLTNTILTMLEQRAIMYG